MHQRLKDNIICRIISGKLMLEINNQIYIVHQPDNMIKLRAQLIYNQAYDDTLFEGWMTQSKIKKLLVFYELIDADIEDKMKLANKTIDGLKISLYQNRSNINGCIDIRNRLNKLRDKYTQWYAMLHSLDKATVEGYAEEIKYYYLLSKTLTDINGKLIWEDENHIDISLLQSIVNEICRNTISVVDYREIARTEPWSSYWRISKGDPFNIAIIDWTEEQKTLALFSRIYDNVYQHTECPEEFVIEDDDMLDGWFLFIQSENEKEKFKKQIDKKGDKYNKATEMFIPVEDDLEAQRINEMNTPQNKLIKKRRMETIQKKGRVTEANLPDVKTKLFMDAQKLAIDSMRGKKR